MNNKLKQQTENWSLYNNFGKVFTFEIILYLFHVSWIFSGGGLVPNHNVYRICFLSGGSAYVRITVYVFSLEALLTSELKGAPCLSAEGKVFAFCHAPSALYDDQRTHIVDLVHPFPF